MNQNILSGHAAEGAEVLKYNEAIYTDNQNKDENKSGQSHVFDCPSSSRKCSPEPRKASVLDVMDVSCPIAMIGLEMPSSLAAAPPSSICSSATDCLNSVNFVISKAFPEDDGPSWLPSEVSAVF